MQKYVKTDRGFSLVEMVIGIAVMGILILVITPLIWINVKSYMNVHENQDVIQATRLGFNRMMAELEQIDEPKDITFASATSIEVDVPDDGLGDIVFEYSGGKLLRNGYTLVDHVEGMHIGYFRPNGSQISTPFSEQDDVWRILIEMEVVKGDKSFELKGQVSPKIFHFSATE